MKKFEKKPIKFNEFLTIFSVYRQNQFHFMQKRLTWLNSFCCNFCANSAFFSLKSCKYLDDNDKSLKITHLYTIRLNMKSNKNKIKGIEWRERKKKLNPIKVKKKSITERRMFVTENKCQKGRFSLFIYDHLLKRIVAYMPMSTETTIAATTTTDTKILCSAYKNANDYFMWNLKFSSVQIYEWK